MLLVLEETAMWTRPVQHNAGVHRTPLWLGQLSLASSCWEQKTQKKELFPLVQWHFKRNPWECEDTWNLIFYLYPVCAPICPIWLGYYHISVTLFSLWTSQFKTVHPSDKNTGSVQPEVWWIDLTSTQWTHIRLTSIHHTREIIIGYKEVVITTNQHDLVVK